MVGNFAGCACAASGQATAEPANTLMNSRRLIGAPVAQGKHLTGSNWESGSGPPMSALGHKRTYAVQKGMSDLRPKAGIRHLVGMSALHGFACSTIVREFAAVGLRTTDHSQN
jgi:hypothetical protein